MTPSDDEIIAAAMEAGFAISTAYGQGANKLMPISDRATLGALYRAAYAAGMEAAAVICDAQMEYFIDRTVYIGVAGAGKCADAIRAANSLAEKPE